MSNADLTSLTLRLPVSLRERLKRQTQKEERTESQFVRYHLAKLLDREAASNRKPAA